MIKKILIFSFLALYFCQAINAQKSKSFEVKSPDGNILTKIEINNKIQWSVTHSGQEIISPSSISLSLSNGEILGNKPIITNQKTEIINNTFDAINYKKAKVIDNYNQLTISFKDDYSLVFRAYNDGIAYRFVTQKKGEIQIKNEEANFNFTNDYIAHIPYMWDYRGGKFFNHSFENLYKEIKISKFATDSLAFLPVMVSLDNNKKAVILEADLEDYPGMYLNKNNTQKGFMGVFPAYPLEVTGGGYQGMNIIPTKRADYIAKTNGNRNFPWRAVIISKEDKELLNNDMVQKLAAPCRLADISWITPGQVAWDWWNNWNITGVDFKSGINTDTYKYYIDFASANNIKYIVMDEGWAEGDNILKTSPQVDVKEIVRYGKTKNVDVILWALWRSILKHADEAFPLYEKMGVKGFKIDFFDRDDQIAVASTYEIAKKAAQFHLLVDYHGIYKPTGLQRTFPNVIGYEGVKGLENYKWANEDQPRYCVSIPYIRQLAGPMDYTPGAFRNSTQANYRPSNSLPMSKGTRCNQMAMYVIHEAPLQMLADNPSIYKKEQECTDFIVKIPSFTDETVALDGKVSEFVALARKKGETWFAAAMTNWTPREISIDCSFLGEGNYQATIFKDGMNAEKDPTDYKKESLKVTKNDKIKVLLAPGGGWVARFEKL